MEVSARPRCLKKCLTESACSTEVNLMNLAAEAAFCEENPHEFIKKSAMGLDLGGGLKVLAAAADANDEEKFTRLKKAGFLG